jgi:hypothetical protein
MNNPLFLLGAGFNLDANEEAGYHNGYNKEDFLSCELFGDVGYPLANNLKKICFPAENNSSISIEELFYKAINSNYLEPIIKLCKKIIFADGIIVPKLLPESKHPNCYLDFFNRFKTSSFLTFNYDSLPEIFLYKLNHWNPHDGYGCSVESNFYGTSEEKTKLLQNASKSLVVHLHGSLYVLTSNFDLIEEKESYNLVKPKKPTFTFDPQTPLFHPNYDSVPPQIVNESLENRIIAPIPDKTKGLKKDFIDKMYSKAKDFINNTNQIVVIGYNFSEHDKSSYHNLIQDFKNEILIISPNAEELKDRLKNEYTEIQWYAESSSFKVWVDNIFRGLN